MRMEVSLRTVTLAPIPLLHSTVTGCGEILLRDADYLTMIVLQHMKLKDTNPITQHRLTKTIRNTVPIVERTRKFQ